MKKINCFLILITFISGPFFPKSIDLIEKVSPLFVYSNFGGFFYAEGNDLIIYEALYKDTGKIEKPPFIGYNKLGLVTELFVKGRKIDNSSIHLENIPQINFEESTEEVNKLNEQNKLALLNENRKITFEYKKCKFELEYNNLNNDLFADKLFLTCLKKNKYYLIKNSSYLAWYKIFNNCLILACHSQGGSGHKISLEIYDIERIYNLIK